MTGRCSSSTPDSPVGVLAQGASVLILEPEAEDAGEGRALDGHTVSIASAGIIGEVSGLTALSIPALGPLGPPLRGKDGAFRAN